MTIFRCPLCGGPLWEVPGGLRCPKGHRFDRAKEGYVHLLPVGQKHSLAPGDDKAMVSARRAFLDKGWYAPLREALEQLAVAHTGNEPVVLDAGCGEGYYTQGVRQALTSAGKAPHVAGFDISKFAVQKAAKRCPELDLAVASAYHLPVADEAVDLVLNVFSPLAIEEFRRVLKKADIICMWFPPRDTSGNSRRSSTTIPTATRRRRPPTRGLSTGRSSR